MTLNVLLSKVIIKYVITVAYLYKAALQTFTSVKMMPRK